MSDGPSGIANRSDSVDVSGQSRRGAPEQPGGHIARIALLTPYSGNNFGDAAIQDAAMVRLRQIIPVAEFSGITLNCDNFIARHGKNAFPLCATDRPFFGMSRAEVVAVNGITRRDRWTLSTAKTIKRVSRQIPLLGRGFRGIRRVVACSRREICHVISGYRFLRKHNLLLISGGGQLDEEWGGPWGHPFALFKWSMLARLAGVPCAIASVGACQIATPMSRFFLSAALSMATYRSYRDGNSRAIASGLCQAAARDGVIPDLAFSMPKPDLPLPHDYRSLSGQRPVVAISPITYGRPQNWPGANPAVYLRYLDEMAQVIEGLVERNCFVLLVRSASSDDAAVCDLLERFAGNAAFKLSHSVPGIETWQDLVAALRGSDAVVASRLHSTILSFVSGKPVVAISFDTKVDWLMRDCGQEEYLLQIGDFQASDVLAGLDRLESNRATVQRQLVASIDHAQAAAALQYEMLAELAESNLRDKGRS